MKKWTNNGLKDEWRYNRDADRTRQKAAEQSGTMRRYSRAKALGVAVKKGRNNPREMGNDQRGLFSSCESATLN